MEKRPLLRVRGGRFVVVCGLWSIVFSTVCLAPAAGIDEGFEPGGTLVGGTGVVGILPGEEGTLQVGHHGEMATIGGADTCGGEIGTVGVAGISIVGVFENDVVVLLLARQ